MYREGKLKTMLLQRTPSFVQSAYKLITNFKRKANTNFTGANIIKSLGKSFKSYAVLNFQTVK